MMNAKKDGRSPGHERMIAGHPCSWWVKRFDLPLHICRASAIRENLRAFGEVFRARYPAGRVRFAGKACPHPEVFRLAAREGAGIDAASYNEARAALDAGIDPREIDLNGNCKEDSLIEEAIGRDFLIIADSIEEFLVVSAIAKRLRKRPRVLLRLSGFEVHDVTAEAIFTAGRWTKFGAGVDDVPAFLRTLARHRHLDFLGFHCHIGSQITELSPYLVVLGRMIELGHAMKGVGLSCRVLNIGGGFPVSYVDRQRWRAIQARIREGHLASQSGDPSRLYGWNDALAGYDSGPGGAADFRVWRREKPYTELPKQKMLEAILDGRVVVDGRSARTVAALEALGTPQLMVEPGRSIVEDAGVTLARVGHVRTIASHHDLLTLEMGVTSYCEAMFHMMMNRWQLVTGPARRGATGPFEAFVGGNLCFSGDMLCRFKIELARRPVRGDIVMIEDTGAYVSQFMACNANANPRPARVLVRENGRTTVLRTRDDYSEVYSLRRRP